MGIWYTCSGVPPPCPQPSTAAAFWGLGGSLTSPFQASSDQVPQSLGFWSSLSHIRDLDILGQFFLSGAHGCTRSSKVCSSWKPWWSKNHLPPLFVWLCFLEAQLSMWFQTTSRRSACLKWRFLVFAWESCEIIPKEWGLGVFLTSFSGDFTAEQDVRTPLEGWSVRPQARGRSF